jgi:hypothetical protein
VRLDIRQSSGCTPITLINQPARFGSASYSERQLRLNLDNLRAVKLVHTAVWVFFVACILALPVSAALGRFDLALAAFLLVLCECGVLALNRGKCPLTGVAARYTEDRADNFDIYLPLWLARHNKSIFGTLFVAGAVFALARWLG